MAKLLAYSENRFRQIAEDEGWTLSYIPDDVAIVSICEPYSENGEWWKHLFEHDGKHVYNLNIPDIDPLLFQDVLKDTPSDKCKIYEWENHKDFWIFEQNGNKQYCFNPDEAFGLANFIVRNAGKDFYIHCAAGLSRSQGVVKAILKNYPEFYNQSSLNQNNLPNDELSNKWVEYLLDRWIKRIKY